MFDIDDIISSSQQPDDDERTLTLLIFQTRILKHSRWQNLNCDLGSKRQAHDRAGEVPSEEAISEADGEAVFLGGRGWGLDGWAAVSGQNCWRKYESNGVTMMDSENGQVQ